MKTADWSDEELAARRSRIESPSALRAFDMLVSYGISSPTWRCGPGGHGHIKDVVFKAEGETPFAFITNRGDLLFYLRSAGVRGLRARREELARSFSEVTEGGRGELKIRIRNEADARLVIDLILEKWGSAAVGVVQAQGAPVARSGWSREEVEATVADYFAMLLLELTGQPYNKAAHNRELQLKLANRSQAAVELKHQNISAILIEMGCVYIAGYKPRGNYQQLLRDVIEDRLLQDQELQAAATRAVERDSKPVKIRRLSDVLVDPPKVSRVSEPSSKPYVRRAIHCDYLEREARNRSLGLAGELFIAEFEAQRLHAGGHKVLANRVEHISKSRGDGLGYDVLSFEPSGKERLIEVKTTAFGALTPFFVSSNEVRFSEERNSEFVLARVHEFRAAPKFFELRGSMKKSLRLDPVSYRARL